MVADQFPVRIRPRLTQDIPALAAVLVQVHCVDGYPVDGVADPGAWLLSDRMIDAWTADFDGRPCGHAMLTRPSPGEHAARIGAEYLRPHSQELALLRRVFVSPGARGCGIGSQLTNTPPRPHAPAVNALSLT